MLTSLFQRNTKWPLFLLVIFSAILTWVIYTSDFLWKEPEPSNSTQANRDSEEALYSENSTTNQYTLSKNLIGNDVPSHTPPVATVQQFRSAANAIDAHDMALRMREEGQYYLSDWAEVEIERHCRGSFDFDSLPSDTRHQISRPHFDKLGEYCEGWDSSLLSEDIKALRSKTRHPRYSKFKIREDLTSSDQSSRSDLVIKLINSSVTPDEVSRTFAALIDLKSRSNISVDLGQIPNLDESTYTDAMSVAQFIVNCQRFSGCGPNSPQVLSYCIIARESCSTTGMDMVDMLAFIYSPYVLNQATLIARTVLQSK